MAYDKAGWHCGGDFPDDVPHENGGTHIGLFLAWAILNDLEGDLHREESAGALADVRRRRVTGRGFLFKECDGKFWEEDLDDLGNAFARHYYGDGGESGLYFADYVEALCGGDYQKFYYVEDTWQSYDRLAPVISRRFEDWKPKNV